MDNFNLAKSLRNTCEIGYFLLKMNSFAAIFQNIFHYISKILPTFFKNTFFKEHLLLLRK